MLSILERKKICRQDVYFYFATTISFGSPLFSINSTFKFVKHFFYSIYVLGLFTVRVLPIIFHLRKTVLNNVPASMHPLSYMIKKAGSQLSHLPPPPAPSVPTVGTELANKQGLINTLASANTIKIRLNTVYFVLRST